MVDSYDSIEVTVSPAVTWVLDCNPDGTGPRFSIQETSDSRFEQSLLRNAVQAVRSTGGD